jgi:hypothetical protein
VVPVEGDYGRARASTVVRHGGGRDRLGRRCRSGARNRHGDQHGRLFSFISINWRGRPLRTYETIINLIGNTTNRGGLVVRVRLDRRRYPTGKKISKKELRELKVECEEFHGEWNYVIRSRMEQR